MRIVNHWFAMDAIWGTGTGSTEGYVAWGAEFPPKKGRHLLDPTWRDHLEADPKWLVWERHVRDAIERCRELRNGVVHHGHRRVDVSQRDVVWLDAVALAAARSSEAMVVVALQTGWTEQSELVSHLGAVFAAVHESPSKLVRDRVDALARAHARAQQWP